MKAALLPSSPHALFFTGNRIAFSIRAGMERVKTHLARKQPSTGKVWLVGAGPGDPDLLTLRAVKLLKCADVIIYDHLVSREVLALARPRARMICAGKRAGRHSMPQHDINALLVREARRSKIVVRLKGGDPGIFGRAGEEIETLRQNGIDYAIVPGITAALGCAAALGIPLTQRGLARSVHFATGHVSPQGSEDIDWSRLADPMETIVLYMARSSLKRHAAQLSKAGLAADTPVLIIWDGTLKTQTIETSTLIECTTDLPIEDRNARPALIIIGKVAGTLDIAPGGPQNASQFRSLPWSV